MTRYLSVADVTKILRQAYKTSHRDHLLCLLQFQHAGRAIEMSQLNISDIRDGILHLRRAKNSLETWQKLITSKNILFDEPSALAAWMYEHPTKKGALFPSRKGKEHMRPDTIGKIVKSIMLAAGVPEPLAHDHQLKHARLASLRRQGMDLDHLKKFAGHRSLSSTLIYVNLSDEEATGVAQKLSDQMVQEG